MSWRIAIDVGGTFTDVVAVNDDTGKKVVRKASSTPSDFSVGYSNGLRLVLDAAGIAPEDVSLIFHGTTAATNAIIEGRYARTGLIVNRGYRHMLECARQLVPGDFGDISWWIKPPRVVPIELIREISGRLDAGGDELAALDEAEVRWLAGEFKQLGITAIAVSLLHSYRNPAHEQCVREWLVTEYPECHVSVSSDVIREYREYERTLSTCLNTSLKPMVSRYVERLQERTRDQVGEPPLYIMKSSGGLATTDEFVERPIGAVLSGPAAGVIAAGAISQALGFGQILTLDVGGTSADIALVEAGEPRLRTEGKIGIYDLKVPMIDMTAVGAGGGSVAWLSASGSLRVGPQSAGSQPGPVCYGHGGTEPTVTDAHLVLGRVSTSLLGGAVQLDAAAARSAIEAHIAERLGLSVEAASDAILEIAIQNMAAGVRLESVRRGRDPRDFALFAFGGAGGLHACRTAEALEISTVLIPLSPGATSAEGLLFSDLRLDEVRTEVVVERDLDTDSFLEELEALRGDVAERLGQRGFASSKTRFELFADLRYAGQAYELRVTVPLAGPFSDQDLRKIFDGFHAVHEDRFGFTYHGETDVELVNHGVTGFGILPRPPLRRSPHPSAEPGIVAARRDVFDRRTGTMVSAAIHDRLSLEAGTEVTGPAIIEQCDSTTVVERGWIAKPNELGHLVVTREVDHREGS
jgi:N-methylhydantoinase A